MTKRKKSLRQITTEIKAIEKTTVGNVIEIGARLHDVQNNHLEHGQYQQWLADEFSWSYRSALRYVRAFLFYVDVEKRQIGTFKKLNLSVTALHLAAAPSTNKATRKKIVSTASKRRVTYTAALNILIECQPGVDDRIKYDPIAEEVDPPSPPIPRPGTFMDDDDNNSRQLVSLLLQRLDATLRDPEADLSQAVADIGSDRLGEIIEILKRARDAYSASKAKNEIRAKADAAEARRNAGAATRI
jgi:Protein of unknown function (DUF3102)